MRGRHEGLDIEIDEGPHDTHECGEDPARVHFEFSYIGDSRPDWLEKQIKRGDADRERDNHFWECVRRTKFEEEIRCR